MSELRILLQINAKLCHHDSLFMKKIDVSIKAKSNKDLQNEKKKLKQNDLCRPIYGSASDMNHEYFVRGGRLETPWNQSIR